MIHQFCVSFVTVISVGWYQKEQTQQDEGEINTQRERRTRKMKVVGNEPLQQQVDGS